MREYTIKGIIYKVYEGALDAPDNIKFLDNWREGDVGDWVLADDGRDSVRTDDDTIAARHIDADFF